MPCWIAPRDVRPGEAYAAAIVDAINDSEMLVLLVSRHAVDSPHVLREVERASSKRRSVLSIRTDATELPPEFEYFLSANQWLDASDGRMENVIPALVAAVRGQDTGNSGRDALAAGRSSGRRRRGALVPGESVDELFLQVDLMPFLNTSKTFAVADRLNARIAGSSILDSIAGKRILDIASHDGRWSFAVMKAGATHVTGIEPGQTFPCELSAVRRSQGPFFVYSGGHVRRPEECGTPIGTILCLGLSAEMIGNYPIEYSGRWRSTFSCTRSAPARSP